MASCKYCADVTCDCDMLLTGVFRGFSTPTLRLILVAKYQNKYQSTLSMPHWSNEDLAELSPTLREAVEKQQRLKYKIQNRITYLKKEGATGVKSMAPPTTGQRGPDKRQRKLRGKP